MSNFDNHHHRWNEQQEATLNRCLVDRTLVASALQNLLTAVQFGTPRQLRQAEIEGKRALSIVGGPIVTKTGETSC